MNDKIQISKKQLLKLGMISAVAIALGALVGLVLNYETLKNLQKPSEVSSVPVTLVEEEERQEKIATYSGKIKPSIRPEIAAHYLESAEGEIIIFLKSGKIESGFLEMLEGQAVEVAGEIVETTKDGQEVLEVDEVHL